MLSGLSVPNGLTNLAPMIQVIFNINILAYFVMNIIQSKTHDSITPISKAFPIQQDDPE
jgi:hypothetical protein